MVVSTTNSPYLTSDLPLWVNQPPCYPSCSLPSPSLPSQTQPPSLPDRQHVPKQLTLKMLAPKLIIFDFDGTLFDTHASIAHCISRTFALLSPPEFPRPSLSTIHAIIAKGVGLSETFQTLQTDGANPSAITDIDLWASTYRTLYAEEGLPLISLFPGAHVSLLSIYRTIAFNWDRFLCYAATALSVVASYPNPTKVFYALMVTSGTATIPESKSDPRGDPQQ